MGDQGVYRSFYIPGALCRTAMLKVPFRCDRNSSSCTSQSNKTQSFKLHQLRDGYFRYLRNRSTCCQSAAPTKPKPCCRCRSHDQHASVMGTRPPAQVVLVPSATGCLQLTLLPFSAIQFSTLLRLSGLTGSYENTCPRVGHLLGSVKIAEPVLVAPTLSRV